MALLDEAIIEGWRDPMGEVHVVIDRLIPARRTPLRHVVHHSPDGFEWGYDGSGPADLALSILVAVIGPEPTTAIFRRAIGKRAWDLHLSFKSDFVQAFAKRHWLITAGAVRAWIKEQRELEEQP